jgi:alpha-beta hydrolase superfamily lysophospholipase
MTSEVEEFIKQNQTWKLATTKDGSYSQDVELIEGKVAVSIAPYDNKFLNIFYRHFKQSKQPKGVVVLFHGLGTSSSLLAPVANTLRQLPVDIFAFDMFGHGRSEGIWNTTNAEEGGSTPHEIAPDCYIPDYRLLYSVAWRFLYQVVHTKHEKRLKDLPIFLYGHGLGGSIIVSMLLNQHAENPVCKRVKGVVLENAAIHLYDEPQSSVVLSLLKGVSTLLPQLPTNFAYQSTSSNLNTQQFDNYSRIKATVEWRATNPECYQHSIPLGTSREVLNMLEEIKSKFEQQQMQLDVPMFIYHGTADKVCNISGSMFLSKVNKNSDTQYVAIQDGVHCLFADLCAKKVLEDVSSWILKHL